MFVKQVPKAVLSGGFSKTGEEDEEGFSEELGSSSETTTEDNFTEGALGEFACKKWFL